MGITENNTKVIIPKEIITYLMDLADTLFEKDYYSYIEYANILIDDILDFIPTFLRFVTGSLLRVLNLMLATKDKGCAR